MIGKSQAENALPPFDSAPVDSLAARPRCFGPGSDIARGDDDVLIQTVNDTHLLVFNKFCTSRPELLLLTADSYRRQHEQLLLEDLQAAWTVLSGTSHCHYVLYNCTSKAGGSREHKHMHVIPKPPILSTTKGGFRLFPDSKPPVPLETIPFVHFIQYFRDSSREQAVDGHDLLNAYSTLLARTREALYIPDDDPICPHNVILTKDWIISIPRQTNDFHGISANGAGMMGSVKLMSHAQVDDWKAVGPAKVLSKLGIPADKGNLQNVSYPTL